MKRIISIIFLASFIFILNSCDQVEQKSNEKKTSEVSQREVPKKLLRHVVLFNFNDAADSAKVKEIEQAFITLPEKISEIHSFEWGTNNSEEGLDKGLTHCFFVTFLSKEDRDTYLPHPEHQNFVKLLDGYVEDVTVVDYWTQ